MPRRRFISEQSRKKIEVKRRSDWTGLTKQRTTISFEISVNNRLCSGSSLESLIEWVGTGWANVQFSVGDTLHRFNIQAAKSGGKSVYPLEEAEREARLLGDIWETENSSTLAKYEQDFEIVRWDAWRERDEFRQYCELYSALYGSDSKFRMAIEDDIRKHNARRGIAFDLEEARQHEYIIEEIAVYRIQSESGDLINIYPGGALNSLRYVEMLEDDHFRLNRHFAYVRVSDKLTGL